MDVLSILLTLCLMGVGFAKPASNEQLDKATINDYAINAVSEDQKVAAIPQFQQQQVGPPTTVEISGISTAVQKEPVEFSQQQQETPKPGSAFARFIDDIFQIPISVLQNVAKLISNPFTQAKKDAIVNAKLNN